MNCDTNAEINVHSPTKATPSVLSPTALQPPTETEDTRNSSIEIDDKSTSPRVLTDAATPVASPITSPLSQALSHLSQLSLSKKNITSSPPSPTSRHTAVYESDLIAYSDYQASKLSYPIGCPVWYIYDNESSPNTILTKVRYGKVAAVAMNVHTRSFVYKIQKHAESLSNNEPLDLVLEDHIAYASSCPVRVTMGDRVVDGTIICPSNLKDFTGSNSTNKTYSVMLTLRRGNELSIEHDVCSEMIRYRVSDDDELVVDGEVAKAVVDDALCAGFSCW
jgi:ferredoxin-thioredoxin reductase catalytic subunit